MALCSSWELPLTTALQVASPAGLCPVGGDTSDTSVSLGMQGWKCSCPQAGPAELGTEMQLVLQQSSDPTNPAAFGHGRAQVSWNVTVIDHLVVSPCSATPSLGQPEVTIHPTPQNPSLIPDISTIPVYMWGDGLCFWSHLLWGQY